MAKARLHPLFEHLRGTIKGMVFRLSHNGRISAYMSPDMSGVRWSTAQERQRERLAEASAYGKAAIADPEICAIYLQMSLEIKGNERPYDMAVMDYFRANNLLERGSSGMWSCGGRRGSIGNRRDGGRESGGPWQAICNDSIQVLLANCPSGRSSHQHHSPGCAASGEGRTDTGPDWFYPAWTGQAKYSQPIRVRDTDSALGRYSLRTKEIGLKDLARMHGHLCDGLVIAFVEIRAVLERLFPHGVVDRTDLRAVSKNGPCWVDAIAFMTGARINFQTLRIDNRMGNGFIIQRISTGETHQVSLQTGVFPAQQATLESRIRSARAEGQAVSASEIDEFERLSDQLSRKMLTMPPSTLLEVRPLPNYRFVKICRWRYEVIDNMEKMHSGLLSFRKQRSIRKDMSCMLFKINACKNVPDVHCTEFKLISIFFFISLILIDGFPGVTAGCRSLHVGFHDGIAECD